VKHQGVERGDDSLQGAKVLGQISVSPREKEDMKLIEKINDGEESIGAELETGVEVDKELLVLLAIGSTEVGVHAIGKGEQELKSWHEVLLEGPHDVGDRDRGSALHLECKNTRVRNRRLVVFVRRRPRPPLR
jgi:hypothetical protein